MKNDYWSNERQDYIENNQHKKICRILENESNTVTISWSDESHEQMAKNWQESLKTIFWYRSVRSREYKNNSLHADLTTWKNEKWLLVQRRPWLRRKQSAQKYLQNFGEWIKYWSTEGSNYIGQNETS